MSSTDPSSRMTGIGRVLVIVYAVMALAATGRSFVQIVRRFDEAPLAYALSALAAVVYILATLALDSRNSVFTRFTVQSAIKMHWILGRNFRSRIFQYFHLL